MDDLSSLLSLSMARKSVQFCCWGFGQPGGLELHWEMYVEIPHRLIPIAQRWWIVPNKSQKKLTRPTRCLLTSWGQDPHGIQMPNFPRL